MAYSPPKHLDEAAQQKWAELLPELEAGGYVYAGDLDALAGYCAAWSHWIRAEPDSIEAMRALRSLRLWSRELRFLRNRAKASRPGPEMKDELDNYIMQNLLVSPPTGSKKRPRKPKKCIPFPRK